LLHSVQDCFTATLVVHATVLPLAIMNVRTAGLTDFTA